MDNQIKANPDKCHFICSTNGAVNLIVENQIIDNSKCEKLGLQKSWVEDKCLIRNSTIDGL